MASACVNTIKMSQETFLERPSYAWLSPRISYTEPEKPKPEPETKPKQKTPDPDPEISFVDFEFQLENPVKMLPADELFSEGKLVPLQISTTRPSLAVQPPPPPPSEITTHIHRRTDISPTDPYLFSPKATTCSIRWKELLRLKKLYQSTKQEDINIAKTTTNSSTLISPTTNSSVTSINNNHKNSSSSSSASRSLKYFLHRGGGSTSKSSLNTSSSLDLSPLLKETTDIESLSSSSSRLSLSSSSSRHEHEDVVHRLSLDSDINNNNNNKGNVKPRNSLSKVRVSTKHRSPMRRVPEAPSQPIGVSMDSPRMNSSGKIVFQSLERSSSSPSTFNGGPRHKHRGMERSYSANVRITPVLNVPVCSLRGSSKSGVFGLPMFASSSSTQTKKDGNAGGAGGGSRSHQRRVDRT